MSREKQIEEMTHILCGMENGCDSCMFQKTGCFERFDAEQLYNARYRKQDWISVEERLPDFEGKYLVYTIKGNVTIAYCYSPSWESNPQFDYWVTHWMHLPEPPKGE